MVELLSLKFVNFAVRFQILSISVLPSQWGTHTLLCHAAKTWSSLYLEDNMLHHFKEKYEKKCKFYLRECRFQGKSCGGSYTVAVLCCPWDAFCSCSVPVPLHVPVISFTSHDIRQRQKWIRSSASFPRNTRAPEGLSAGGLQQARINSSRIAAQRAAERSGRAMHDGATRGHRASLTAPQERLYRDLRGKITAFYYRIVSANNLRTEYNVNIK